ncbi:CAP domain-containing protein [Mycetocola zhadangensis]|uniref:CAP domain-containing protein n=1 Tax=Mycetocola zhadangensis TaxID=1164595 RepID=UPI0016014973|nr:CAP domain-containing protein [Mycetocola zhadangensis]GGE85002.1 hypothetical protein GCM10011313_04360 [Mycetocola zhadangensis]
MFTLHAPANRGRLLTATLAAVALAVALISVPAPARAAEPVVGGYSLSQARKIILDDTNAIRTGLGLKPVVESAALNSVAQNWSTSQAQVGAMSHNPAYSSQYPAGWTTASENVAYGYAVTAVVAGWKASPGHYRNITQSSANVIGIGVAADSNGRLYYTQNFATYPASAVPAPPTASPGTPAPSSASIRNAGDVVVIDGAGSLWNYGKQGEIGAVAPTRIGTGWQGIKELHVTDWNSDGVQDLVAQRKSGTLSVYPGLKTGGFGTAFLIGSGGWGDVEVDIAKWKATDAYPSVLRKDGAGALWLYPNAQGKGLSPRTAIASGWSGLTVKIVDFDKDGKQDVLATNSAGDMLLYRTNGSGSFVNEPRPRIGSGWSGFTAVVLTGFAGADSAGIIAKDPAGRLLYYPIVAKAFGSPQVLGASGWGPMTLSNN